MTGFESFIYALGSLTFSVAVAGVLLWGIGLVDRPRKEL